MLTHLQLWISSFDTLHLRAESLQDAQQSQIRIKSSILSDCHPAIYNHLFCSLLNHGSISLFYFLFPPSFLPSSFLPSILSSPAHPILKLMVSHAIAFIKDLTNISLQGQYTTRSFYNMLCYPIKDISIYNHRFLFSRQRVTSHRFHLLHGKYLTCP